MTLILPPATSSSVKHGGELPTQVSARASWKWDELPSRRREFCHSAAPPLSLQQAFQCGWKGGVPAKWQSRRRRLELPGLTRSRSALTASTVPRLTYGTTGAAAELALAAAAKVANAATRSIMFWARADQASAVASAAEHVTAQSWRGGAGGGTTMRARCRFRGCAGVSRAIRAWIQVVTPCHNCITDGNHLQ